MSKKTYIGISRDHSSSMSTIARDALVDFNSTIEAIRTESAAAGQHTYVSVVECTSSVSRVLSNSPIERVIPITHYRAHGLTALFDSVGDLITQFERHPDANNPDASFLILSITDGEENSSVTWSAARLLQKIRDLQGTDRWTFVFRVPRGYGAKLARQFGIPEGNILEWDQTSRGVQVATEATRSAFTQYYTDRAAGATSTKRFYANMADVDIKTVKAALVDISGHVNLWLTSQREVIKPYCERMSKQDFIKGAAFYQLTKSEREVQDYKQIVIRDKQSGAVYGGATARDLLGLPKFGTIPLHPGDHGQYDIYIQSTSVNRVLPAGTQLLYWPTWQTPPAVATPSHQAAKKVSAVITAQAAQAQVKPGTPSVAKAAITSALTKPVAPKVNAAGHDADYQRGYSEGFEHGKRKTALVVLTSSGTSYRDGYLAGYKDGRGKKKRLYKL